MAAEWVLHSCIDGNSAPAADAIAQCKTPCGLTQEAHLPGEAAIRLAVMMTVFLSIFAHGLSALPGISLYARQLAALDAGVPEHQGVEQRLPGAAH